MQAIEQHIDKWMNYITTAFDGDDDIVGVYDKSVTVKTINDVCENVMDKLTSVKEEIRFYGVDADDLPIGYFAVQNENILLSFGVHILYRTKEWLAMFFGIIKRVIGREFFCYLFSYNQRAISWLKKSGMTILFDNVTLLQCQL